MNSLELKPLTTTHLPAILELDQLCFGSLWTLAGYQRELDSPNSDLIGLFTWVPPASPTPPAPLLSYEVPSGALLAMGCFWTILDEAHITILAVHPLYRRQGLGQALLTALLTRAALARALERATLEVRASNSSALCLYQKFGFKPAGRRRGYYQDAGGEDALILWHGGLRQPEFLQTLASWQQEAVTRLSTSNWNLPTASYSPFS
ncbi:MAG: ribosomal protein S18-alanine N-acetyltransferase [Chroococcidiopsidaceae cyanobacterium CP_BM_RX_35]|nr:ribosomal protein S18-alanine N-acetyltransferase [Chroococcidiopsidaceae cyanobacterium CP_BM_RX_35]